MIVYQKRYLDDTEWLDLADRQSVINYLFVDGYSEVQIADKMNKVDRGEFVIGQNAEYRAIDRPSAKVFILG
jgi:hypothetical protein